MAHLFRGGGLESSVDSTPPRLKPWATLPQWLMPSAVRRPVYKEDGYAELTGRGWCDTIVSVDLSGLAGGRLILNGALRSIQPTKRGVDNLGVELTTSVAREFASNTVGVVGALV